MHGKYLMLPTAIRDASIQVETMGYWECVAVAFFVAIMLFVVYSIVWYIGGKLNDNDK